MSVDPYRELDQPGSKSRRTRFTAGLMTTKWARLPVRATHSIRAVARGAMNTWSAPWLTMIPGWARERFPNRERVHARAFADYKGKPGSVAWLQSCTLAMQILSGDSTT